MKTAIWIRVSTLDQKRGDSPEVHEKRARLYAESKGWEIVTVYNLAGVSGKTVIEQEETKRMIQDVKEGRVEVLILSKLARLARSTRELLDIADLFKKHNATLVSMQENIDTSSSSGMLFYTILSAMAEWEISETSERIHASIATRRKMGKMAGGMASYGFKIVDAKLEVNQEEASVRKLMYELFLQYKRRKIVARELNIKGFRTRTGKQWSDTTVKRLLKNPDAKGMQIVNYWDYSNGVSKKKPKPREEWIINECPRIVSDELWDSVNAIILEQENANSQSNKPLNQRVNLFTSFLYCNEGHKMSVQSKTRKYSCTQCKLRIDKDDLEEIFHTRLTEFTISPEEIDQYTESSTDVIQGIENEIKASKKKIETLQIKMDKLIELSIDGEIPKKGFKTHYQPLFEQSEALQKHVNIQEGELQNIRRVKNSMGEIISSSHSIYDNWHSLSHPEKRSVIETITKNIIFDGDTIEFTFKQIAPPTYLKSNPNEQRNSATGFL